MLGRTEFIYMPEIKSCYAGDHPFIITRKTYTRRVGGEARQTTTLARWGEPSPHSDGPVQTLNGSVRPNPALLQRFS